MSGDLSKHKGIYIGKVVKGSGAERNICEKFDKLVALSAPKGISVGNLGWIEPLINAGVNVVGDYGFTCTTVRTNLCGKKCEQTNIFLKDRKGSFTQLLQILQTAEVSY